MGEGPLKNTAKDNIYDNNKNNNDFSFKFQIEEEKKIGSSSSTQMFSSQQPMRKQTLKVIKRMTSEHGIIDEVVAKQQVMDMLSMQHSVTPT